MPDSAFATAFASHAASGHVLGGVPFAATGENDGGAGRAQLQRVGTAIVASPIRKSSSSAETAVASAAQPAGCSRLTLYCPAAARTTGAGPGLGIDVAAAFWWLPWRLTS